MSDYTWPSVYFAYLFFALCFALAVFFFIRSWRDGYWGANAEDVKYQLFDDADVRWTTRSSRDGHVPPAPKPAWRPAADLAVRPTRSELNVPR